MGGLSRLSLHEVESANLSLVGRRIRQSKFVARVVPPIFNFIDLPTSAKSQISQMMLFYPGLGFIVAIKVTLVSKCFSLRERSIASILRHSVL